MIEFKAKNGTDPSSNMGAFHEFLRRSLKADVNKNHSTRTRKRPRDAYAQCLGDMVSTLCSFVDVTKTHLETMKEVLLNDHTTSTKRGKLVEELMKIEGDGQPNVSGPIPDFTLKPEVNPTGSTFKENLPKIQLNLP
ncbi:hypothetical protein ACLB2K_006176 [Fragaria x ananassa]